jgi:hypothetical protein
VGEELADRGRDRYDVGLEGEVTCVQETNVGVRQVTLEGLGPRWQEERVVLALYR